ncbi:hypothetical protein ACFLZY_01255 [Patescibacteria group bacterium]
MKAGFFGQESLWSKTFVRWLKWCALLPLWIMWLLIARPIKTKIHNRRAEKRLRSRVLDEQQKAYYRRVGLEQTNPRFITAEMIKHRRNSD